MSIDYQLVSDKSALLPWQASILALFERCYAKPLAAELWRWAYIDNPQGEPVVALALADGELIGHYAVIAYSLCQSGHYYQAALSMTTMVDNAYQGRGLFTRLAQQVYEHLRQNNYDVVFGFPNQNSCHGFKKHLQWQVAEDDYVATVPYRELVQSQDLLAYFAKSDLVTADENNPAYLNWRLNKPGQQYQRSGASIVKAFNGQQDIVLLGADFATELAADATYNVLLDATIEDLKPYKNFNYYHGCRWFNCTQAQPFKKDLLLSDVF